ncbi:MAG: hypothetical protein EA404_09100 [Spirochaetaceae bacterium]|nr:MAG: hypothetical protein EA404_09100 [Spirochaetaceae bacterium]
MISKDRPGRAARHAARVVVTLVTTVVLAGCYWQPGVATGSLRLSFEAPPDTEVGTLQAEEEAARVFLVAGTGYNQRFYPLNPKAATPYLQTAFSLSARFPSRPGAEVVIEDIPDVAPYRVFVATGEPVRGGGFKVLRWGASDLFNIAAGREIGTDILLRDSRPQVSWALPGTAIGGIVAYVDTETTRLFAAGGQGTVYGRTWQENELTGSGSGLVDEVIGERLVIHSIQPGRSEPLLLATSNGLYQGSEPSEQYERIEERGSPRGDTLGAIEFEVADGNPVILYYSAHRIGGRDQAGDWFSIDMRAVVNGVPVTAMATDGEDYAFVATPAGALRIAAADLNAEWTSWKELASNGVFFDGYVPSAINSLAASQPGDSDGALFVGTANGIYVFSGALSSDWNPGADRPSQIRATRGRPIHRIAVHADEGLQRMAAITPFELLIMITDSSGTRSLPFVAAYPGSPTDLAWLDGTHLAVSGSEGIVVLDMSVIP